MQKRAVTSTLSE